MLRRWMMCALVLCGPIRVAAQQPDAAPLVPPAAAGEPAVQDALTVSPGGAFLRAVLVPGWGHAYIAENTRGGFYFLAESASAWMVVKTRLRLNSAKDVRDMRILEARARLIAAGVTDPLRILAGIDLDPEVIGAESLVEARSQQFEDWLVLGLFLVLLSGADAFVSAHLKDFPQPVGVQVGTEQGALQLGIRVPFGSHAGAR